MEAKRITADELKEKMDSGALIQILDVRNKFDYMKSGEAIPGSIRIHVNKILDRLGELDPAVETVAWCT